MSEILSVNVVGDTVQFNWGDDAHVYRLYHGMTEHTLLNALANTVNRMFAPKQLLSVGPAVRSTGDAYEQGVEFGFKLAGRWSECDILVTYDGQTNLYIVWDIAEDKLIARCTTFKIAQAQIDNFLRPKDEAGGSQYGLGLATLLTERNLKLVHLSAGFTFFDENGAMVTQHDNLDVAITQALERTKP